MLDVMAVSEVVVVLGAAASLFCCVDLPARDGFQDVAGYSADLFGCMDCECGDVGEGRSCGRRGRSASSSSAVRVPSGACLGIGADHFGPAFGGRYLRDRFRKERISGLIR